MSWKRGFDPRGAGLEGAAQIERIVDEALARLVAGRALGGRQEVGVVGLEHPFGESLGAGQASGRQFIHVEWQQNGQLAIIRSDRTLTACSSRGPALLVTNDRRKST